MSHFKKTVRKLHSRNNFFIIAFQLHTAILTRKQNHKTLEREGSLKCELLEVFQHVPYIIHFSPKHKTSLSFFKFKDNSMFYNEVHNKRILLMVTELSNRWVLNDLVK